VEFDDYLAITALLADYAVAADTGDFDALAALFRDGMVSSPGGPVSRGYEQVRSRFADRPRDYDVTARRHLTTNIALHCDITGLRAHSRSYFVVVQKLAGFETLQPVTAGTYRDEFYKGPDGWAFTAREIEVGLMSDLGARLY